MRKFVLLFLLTPAFASVHYASQTVKPSAKLVAAAVKFSAKETSYPVRHPVKTASGFAKGTAAVVKTVF